MGCVERRPCPQLPPCKGDSVLPAHVRPAGAAPDAGAGRRLQVRSEHLVSGPRGLCVTATDFSPNAIARTRARLGADGLHATLRREPADRIEQPDASADLVICVGVLDALGPETAARATAEIARVLAPGGRALFAMATDRDFRLSDPVASAMIHGYSAADADALMTPFSHVERDTYETTHGAGATGQSDWLIKVTK
ncbi:class I SAM-dependent methyltransferase [Rhodobacteraceae bacterium CCMM004]|nr:class I SAM-dependent methyltransferase [Rhodobacteraceae bacterium CCMM004]